jgi:hypothetical protein
MNEIYKAEREQISQIITEWNLKLLGLPIKMITENRNKQNRTIRQILGHLTDSAVNNHHRIVRLQYTDNLVFPDYRQDNDRWIKIQDFQNENWEDLVTFWKYYNIHLVHVVGNIDPLFLKSTWHDFEGTTETLDTIVKGYLWHLNLHINEIKELMY